MWSSPVFTISLYVEYQTLGGTENSHDVADSSAEQKFSFSDKCKRAHHCLLVAATVIQSATCTSQHIFWKNIYKLWQLFVVRCRTTLVPELNWKSQSTRRHRPVGSDLWKMAFETVQLVPLATAAPSFFLCWRGRKSRDHSSNEVLRTSGATQ